MLTDSQKWLAVASLVLGGWLLYQLAPILWPFLFACLLAYLSDPLVDRLARWRLTRTLATVTVVVAFGLVTVLLLLLLLPAVQAQAESLSRALPTFLDWVKDPLLPWLKATFGVELSEPDVEGIKAALGEHWQEAGGFVVNVVKYVTQSGLAFAGWLASLVLIPVVTFYMLRDWDNFVGGIHDLLPRHIEPTVSLLTRESDEVLAAFFRGQLMVMLCLGGFYSLGLWIAGLQSALFVGLLAGLVSFVPYLGVIVGIIAASAAVLIQSQDVLQLVWVFAIFGIGQMLEGMLLTPWLVGDRIGLHPVTVIFAVLAGGQLFGFLGILLALPVAAVLAVLVRHARERYQQSNLYGADGEAIDASTPTEKSA